MRKAALKQRSRRRGLTAPSISGSHNDGPTPGPGTNLSATGAENGEKRKPTNEEAALSARNNRLAKELNEIRVRLRDETKTVTRLTMENMNLATRCREAINHVAILKKELTLTQQAIQKENGSESTQQGNVPNEGAEKLVNEIKSSSQEQIGTNAKFDTSPHETYKNDSNLDRFDIFDDNIAVDDEDDNQPFLEPVSNLALHELRDQDRPTDELLFDKELISIDYSADENLSTPIANGIPISTDHFLQPTMQTSLELHNQRENLDKSSTDNVHKKFNQNEFHAFESHPSINVSAFQSMNHTTHPSSASRTIQSRLPNKNSSLDVFEASFENTFPTSFSPSFEEPPPLSIAFDVPEFNDPFFLGPLNLGSDETSGNAFGELKKPAAPSKGKQTSTENTTLKESVPVLNDDFPSSHNIMTGSNGGIPLEQKSAQKFTNRIDDSFKHSNFENLHSTSLDLFPPSTLDVFDFTHGMNRLKYENETNIATRASKNLQNTTTNYRDSSQLGLQKKIGSNPGRPRNEITPEDVMKINDEKVTDNQTLDGDEIHVQDHHSSGIEQTNILKAQTVRKLNQRKKIEETVKETNGVIIPSQSDTSTYHIHKRKSENSQHNNLREKGNNRSIQSNKKASPNSFRGKKTQQIQDINRSSFDRSKKAQIFSGGGSISQYNSNELPSKALGPPNSVHQKNYIRRNVRHPIPYTEPFLNSKLKKGDGIFPKKTLPREVNESRQIISGEKKETDAYDDILKDLASSIINNDT